jgi:hypothetical protein
MQIKDIAVRTPFRSSTFEAAPTVEVANLFCVAENSCDFQTLTTRERKRGRVCWKGFVVQLVPKPERIPKIKTKKTIITVFV